MSVVFGYHSYYVDDDVVVYAIYLRSSEEICKNATLIWISACIWLNMLREVKQCHIK